MKIILKIFLIAKLNFSLLGKQKIHEICFLFKSVELIKKQKKNNQTENKNKNIKLRLLSFEIK